MANQVWYWNDIHARHARFETNIDFVNNGIVYDILTIKPSGPEGVRIDYNHSNGTIGTTAYDADVNAWYNSDAYRTIIFKTPPIGELLIYLQSNATQM